MVDVNELDINKKSPNFFEARASDLVKIQTWNLLSRNQVLYSVELRSQIGLQKYAIIFHLQKVRPKNSLKSKNSPYPLT